MPFWATPAKNAAKRPGAPIQKDRDEARKLCSSRLELPFRGELPNGATDYPADDFMRCIGGPVDDAAPLLLNAIVPFDLCGPV